MNSGTSVVNLAELKLYDLELLERERVLCIVDASNYIKDLYGCKRIARDYFRGIGGSGAGKRGCRGNSDSRGGRG